MEKYDVVGGLVGIFEDVPGAEEGSESNKSTVRLAN
jgi:hypothetical protein